MARVAERLAHTIGSSAAGNVVRSDYRIELECGGKVGPEFRAEALQLPGAERFEGAVMIKTMTHHFPDDGVGAAKRHSLAHQIIGGSGGIQESGFGGRAHAR